MATSPSSLASRTSLVRAVRERYLADVGRAMVEIGDAVQMRWTELVSEVCLSREAQLRRTGRSGAQFDDRARERFIRRPRPFRELPKYAR